MQWNTWLTMKCTTHFTWPFTSYRFHYWIYLAAFCCVFRFFFLFHCWYSLYRIDIHAERSLLHENRVFLQFPSTSIAVLAWLYRLFGVPWNRWFIQNTERKQSTHNWRNYIKRNTLNLISHNECCLNCATAIPCWMLYSGPELKSSRKNE